uniref:Alpha 1,4-glycosyltransferase domain-containing protein n=1 Tax=Timema cristinae TaxID=61476 RepID=A0A7R9HBJ0_TIMCR|nr:unnamed protein product [Timema cristinae]
MFDRTKSLEDLAESFVVAEGNYHVGSSVMRFTADGPGHQVTGALLEEIRTDFRGDQWAHNGPIIVTKVIQQLCGTNSIQLPQGLPYPRSSSHSQRVAGLRQFRGILETYMASKSAFHCWALAYIRFGLVGGRRDGRDDVMKQSQISNHFADVFCGACAQRRRHTEPRGRSVARFLSTYETPACLSNRTKQMTPEQCQGVVIYHPLMFFPVSGVDSKNLFNETLSAITMALIRSSRSYGTHTWNAITADSPIRFGSKQPFSLLAKRFCPSVYYNSGMVF